MARPPVEVGSSGIMTSMLLVRYAAKKCLLTGRQSGFVVLLPYQYVT